MIGGTVYVRDAFTTNDKFIVHDESAINCKSFIMEDSGSFEMCGGTFYAPNATIRVRGNVLIAGSSRDDAVRFSVGEDDGEYVLDGNITIFTNGSLIIEQNEDTLEVGSFEFGPDTTTEIYTDFHNFGVIKNNGNLVINTTQFNSTEKSFVGTLEIESGATMIMNSKGELYFTGDTSGETSGETSGDTSGETSGDTSGDTSGTTSGLTGASGSLVIPAGKEFSINGKIITDQDLRFDSKNTVINGTLSVYKPAVFSGESFRLTEGSKLMIGSTNLELLNDKEVIFNGETYVSSEAYIHGSFKNTGTMRVNNKLVVSEDATFENKGECRFRCEDTTDENNVSIAGSMIIKDTGSYVGNGNLEIFSGTTLTIDENSKLINNSSISTIDSDITVTNGATVRVNAEVNAIEPIVWNETGKVNIEVYRT